MFKRLITLFKLGRKLAKSDVLAIVSKFNKPPYYKLIRGCIVSNTEYTSLNYNSMEGIIYEIDSYGGIVKIFIPFI